MAQNVHLVSIGYRTLAFTELDMAINVYKALNSAAIVTSHYGKLPDGRENIRWILADEDKAKLEAISSDILEGLCTLQELKDAAKAREDIDVQAKVVAEAPQAELTYTPVGPGPTEGPNTDDSEPI